MPRTLDGAVVLLTGGTGSLGQAVVRRLLSDELGRPSRLIVFSRSEATQYAMKTAWKHAYPATDDIYYRNFEELIQFRIGDIRDYAAVYDAVARADVVVHASAMKQVPACEYFPAEAAATNITGTVNLVRAVRASRRAHTVIGISTDKACEPVSVMGMTKAVQERILIEANLDTDDCRLVAVRYGNVLSSRGAVIPLFREQIARGGPVTVTLPEMTRFLLTLDSAVDSVFAAFEEAERGELFVPRLPSARIVDVAKQLIGDRPVEIVYTGIRPGDKIHETLISREEAVRTTERAGHLIVEPHLPEFHVPEGPRPLDGPYTSADPVVTGQDLAKLLARDSQDRGLDTASPPAEHTGAHE